MRIRRFRHFTPGPGGRGHRHGRGKRGEFGGGRDLKRFFAHGDLRLVILHLISEKPRHGYEIIKAIEDAVSGAYSPSPGVIYPTLTMLEELGYVTATPQGAKKSYAITDEGSSFIEANRATLDALLEKMTAAGGAKGGRSPAIFRAMQNLKTALRLRIARGELSDEQIDAIAAEIDATALKIEKA